MGVDEVEAIAQRDGSREANVTDGVTVGGDDPGGVGSDASEEGVAAAFIGKEHGYWTKTS
jgi:hypothetical protein